MTRYKRGELVEVRPTGKYSGENPYRAHLAFNYESGNITGIMRVEPPLVCDSEYLKGVRDDVSVEFTPRMMGRAASLFNFNVGRGVAFNMTPEERVIYSARTILQDAGCMTSLHLLELEATEGQRDDI
jgi:hypothetical protein